MIKRLVLGLLIIVLIVLFTLNNTAPTQLYLVGITVTVPLALLLVIATALGAAIAMLFLVVPAIKERRALRECRQRVEALARQLAARRQAEPQPVPPEESPPETGFSESAGPLG